MIPKRLRLKFLCDFTSFAILGGGATYFLYLLYLFLKEDYLTGPRTIMAGGAFAAFCAAIMLAIFRFTAAKSCYLFSEYVDKWKRLRKGLS